MILYGSQCERLRMLRRSVDHSAPAARSTEAVAKGCRGRIDVRAASELLPAPAPMDIGRIVQRPRVQRDASPGTRSCWRRGSVCRVGFPAMMIPGGVKVMSGCLQRCDSRQNHIERRTRQTSANRQLGWSAQLEGIGGLMCTRTLVAFVHNWVLVSGCGALLVSIT